MSVEDGTPVPTQTSTETETPIPHEINHTDLVVQDGEFAGAVNAYETSPGKLLDDQGNVRTDVPESEQPYVVDGLPIVGANAGEKARNDLNTPDTDTMPSERVAEIENKLKKIREALGRDTTIKDISEMFYDKEETDAMADTVKQMAIDQIPHASEGVKKEVGEQAAANFRVELAKRLNERKSAQDAEAQKKAEEQAAYDEEANKLLVALREGAPTFNLMQAWIEAIESRNAKAEKAEHDIKEYKQ